MEDGEFVFSEGAGIEGASRSFSGLSRWGPKRFHLGCGADGVGPRGRQLVGHRFRVFSYGVVLGAISRSGSLQVLVGHSDVIATGPTPEGIPKGCAESAGPLPGEHAA